jgi:hypothetical protein
VISPDLDNYHLMDATAGTMLRRLGRPNAGSPSKRIAALTAR